MAKSTLLCLVLAIILLLSVFGLSYASDPAAAAPDELQWSPVNIPAEGKNGKWQLAAGSDVDYLAMARDGALYAYANPSGTNYTLFKSVDSGESWSLLETSPVPLLLSPLPRMMLMLFTMLPILRSINHPMAGLFLLLCRRTRAGRGATTSASPACQFTR